MCEKCSYSEIFWSVFNPNAAKYGPEKHRLRTLFVKFNDCLSILPMLSKIYKKITYLQLLDSIEKSFINNPCQSVFYCSHTTTKVLLKFRDHIQRARNSRLPILYNKDVLEYFPKFTGKRLCWNLLLIVLQVLRIANIFKRSTSTGV